LLDVLGKHQFNSIYTNFIRVSCYDFFIKK
jgi:hypothetical protein